MKKQLEKVLSEVLGGLYAVEKYLCEDLDSICDDDMLGYATRKLETVQWTIKKAEDCLKTVQLKSHREMACEVLMEDGAYFITSVSREDVESLGFDTSDLTDAQMAHFADKMANCYLENCYWESIDGLACHYCLPCKDADDEEE